MSALVFRFTAQLWIVSFVGMMTCSSLLWLRKRRAPPQKPATDFAKAPSLQSRDQLFSSLDQFIEASDANDDSTYQTSSFSQLLWKEYESFKPKKNI